MASLHERRCVKRLNINIPEQEPISSPTDGRIKGFILDLTNVDIKGMIEQLVRMGYAYIVNMVENCIKYWVPDDDDDWGIVKR